jgi:hypothetical protein
VVPTVVPTVLEVTSPAGVLSSDRAVVTGTRAGAELLDALESLDVVVPPGVAEVAGVAEVVELDVSEELRSAIVVPDTLTEVLAASPDPESDRSCQNANAPRSATPMATAAAVFHQPGRS